LKSVFSNTETEMNHLWRDFLRTYPNADPIHHPEQCKYYAMLYFYYKSETRDSRKSSEKH